MVSVGTLPGVRASNPKSLPALVGRYSDYARPFLALERRSNLLFAAASLAFLVTPGANGLLFLSVFALLKISDAIKRKSIGAEIANSIPAPEDKTTLRQILRDQENPGVSRAALVLQKAAVAGILAEAYLFDTFYGLSENKGSLFFAVVFSFMVMLRSASVFTKPDPAKTEALLSKDLKKRGVVI